jgi:hypothetical protein
MLAAAFKAGALLRSQRAEVIELSSRLGQGTIDARSVGLAITILRQGGIRRVVERASDEQRARIEPIAQDWEALCSATDVYAQPLCKREGKRVSNACAPKASPGVLAGATIFYGAPTPIYFEDTQGIRSVQARYALVPSEKLLTSHDPTQSFAPTPGYPQELQERDYEGQRIEQEKVRSAAASIRPELIVSTNADALTGPPVIDRRGIVLGGNGRSMALKLAFRANDYRYTEGMRRAVRNDLSYGLFGAPIEPGAVLVRVLERVSDPLRISRLLNSPLGAAQTRETEAISLGQRLGVRSISEIANNLETAQTLNEAIRAAGRRLVEALGTDGIITPYNRAQWLKTRGGEVESELNRFAIERLVDSIVAVAVNNLIVLREASPSQLTTISAIAPWVLLCDRFDRRDATGYNFGPAWRRALPWWIDSEEKRGGEFFSYWFTGALFGDEDAFAVQRKAFLADVSGLQLYAWMFSGGQRALADGARRLWRSIPQQFTASGRTLLGEMDAQEIVEAGQSPEQLRNAVGMPSQAAIEIAGARELMTAIATAPTKLREWKLDDRAVIARNAENLESWTPGKIERVDDSQARAELERSLRGEDESIDLSEWQAPEPRRAARPKIEKVPKVKDPWGRLGLSPKLRARFAGEFEAPRELLRALQRGEKIAGYPIGKRRSTLTDKLSRSLGAEPEKPGPERYEREPERFEREPEPQRFEREPEPQRFEPEPEPQRFEPEPQRFEREPEPQRFEPEPERFEPKPDPDPLKLITMRSRDGIEVLAKLYKGEPMGLTYANETQAKNRLALMPRNEGWRVYQRNRAFVIGRPQKPEQEPQRFEPEPQSEPQRFEPEPTIQGQVFAKEKARTIRDLERQLAIATKKSSEAVDRRSALTEGASRARVSTANAKWERWAEERERLTREISKLRGETEQPQSFEDAEDERAAALETSATRNETAFDVPGWNFWTVDTPQGQTTRFFYSVASIAWNGTTNSKVTFEFTADVFNVRVSVRRRIEGGGFKAAWDKQSEQTIWDSGESVSERQTAIEVCNGLIIELQKERAPTLGWLDPLDLRIASFLLAGFEALEEEQSDSTADKRSSFAQWNQQIKRFCKANEATERWEAEGSKPSVALNRLLRIDFGDVRGADAFDVFDLLPLPEPLGTKIRAQYESNMPFASIQKGGAFRLLQITSNQFPPNIGRAILTALRIVKMPRKVRIYSDDRLSNSDWKREGKPDWWLRNDSIEQFIDLKPNLVPGSEQFDQLLVIPPGKYVLGVGKNPKTMQRDHYTIAPALLPEWDWGSK